LEPERGVEPLTRLAFSRPEGGAVERSFEAGEDSK
jgi:hypothetical protein